MNFQNCEDWLIQAICNLSMAIRLTSEDEADYADYVQLIAAACAVCISKLKYSSEIDTFLSSSSTLATIATPEFPCTGGSGGSSNVIDDQDLEEFGAQLDQVIDRGHACDSPWNTGSGFNGELPDLVQRGNLVLLGKRFIGLQ
jgi:hypothetical protein